LNTNNGANPLRWDCEQRGCFNKKKRPKIEMFAECFPGRISFGDVDGIVEIGGKALLLEWKPAPIEFAKGQSIMYERLSADKKFCILGVAGDAETMEVSHRCHFWGGNYRPWEPATLDNVRLAITEWVKWVKSK